MRIPFVSSISVLGFLQILLWFACFLIVAVTFKVRGYPNEIHQFIPSALIFRHWGLAFSIIPACWTIWATWDLEENEGSEFTLKHHIVIGVSLLIATSIAVVVVVSLAGCLRIGNL